MCSLLPEPAEHRVVVLVLALEQATEDAPEEPLVLIVFGSEKRVEQRVERVGQRIDHRVQGIEERVEQRVEGFRHGVQWVREVIEQQVVVVGLGRRERGRRECGRGCRLLGRRGGGGGWRTRRRLGSLGRCGRLARPGSWCDAGVARGGSVAEGATGGSGDGATSVAREGGTARSPTGSRAGATTGAMAPASPASPATCSMTAGLSGAKRSAWGRRCSRRPGPT